MVRFMALMLPVVASWPERVPTGRHAHAHHRIQNTGTHEAVRCGGGFVRRAAEDVFLCRHLCDEVPEPKVTQASLRPITEQVAVRYVHDRSPEPMHT